MLAVEGPYGVPLKAEDYTDILFVVGGIGITPAISQYRALYQRACEGSLPTVKSVTLVWAVRDAAMIEMFGEFCS